MQQLSKNSKIISVETPSMLRLRPSARPTHSAGFSLAVRVARVRDLIHIGIVLCSLSCFGRRLSRHSGGSFTLETAENAIFKLGQTGRTTDARLSADVRETADFESTWR